MQNQISIFKARLMEIVPYVITFYSYFFPRTKKKSGDVQNIYSITFSFKSFYKFLDNCKYHVHTHIYR